MIPTLQQYLKDNPTKTLEEVQQAEITVDKKQVGSGQARGFFVDTDIWKSLKLIQSDITHPLFSLADAIIVTASDANSYFGIDPDTAEGMSNRRGAQYLESTKVMTSEQLEEFLGMSVHTEKPYKDITLLQFNQAKKLFTEKFIDSQGKDIKITLLEQCPENCVVTTWTKDDFGYDNFGKVCHINTEDRIYKLKLDKKTSPTGIYIRVPFKPLDFEIEVI